MRFGILILLATLFTHSLHAQSKDPFTRAGELYDAGNCPKAKYIYRKLLQKNKLTDINIDIAKFRIAYCDYSLGNLDESQQGFEEILQKYPEEDEARLRLAEVLFAKDEIDKSIEELNKIEDSNFLNDAKILKARAFIENHEGDRALATLKEVEQADPEKLTVVEYWRGTAYYRMFDESSAEKSFQKSFRKSNKDEWTYAASQAWLKSVREGKQPIHARLGVSYGYDTNLGQSTYRQSLNKNPETTYVTKDSFTALDVLLTSKPFYKGKLALTPSAYYYSQTYSQIDNKSYNPTTLAGELAAAYLESRYWTYRLAVSYSEARYNNVFYQNYLTANGSAIYSVSRTMTGHVGFGATRSMGGADGLTFGPTIGFTHETTWFYWLTNAGYTMASGEKATFTTASGATSVKTGSMFSNYSTSSFRIGIGTDRFLGLDVLQQITFSRTAFEKETVPANEVFDIDNRMDRRVALLTSVGKAFFEKTLLLTASLQYVKNTSIGMQGLRYYTGGGSADNNFDRSLIAISASYNY